MGEKLLLIMFMSVLLLSILGTSFVVTAANHGATLVMGTTDFVESAIDPARAYDFFGWEIILNTGCGLVETEPGTGGIMPALATSWSVSDDGLSWNFNLHREFIIFYWIIRNSFMLGYEINNFVEIAEKCFETREET